MRTIKSMIPVVILFAMVSSLPADEPDTRILVFTPTSEGNTYWPQVYDILDAAADDLGIEILGFEFDVGDRFAKSTEGVKILRDTPDVDGAIFSVAFGQTEPLLAVAEELRIPVFIQGPLFESELPGIGYEPRRDFSCWIGYFNQDEFEKGYALGRELLSAATQAGLFAGDGLIHVVGIGGDTTWSGSRERAGGLARAVEEEPRSILLQVVPTQWTPAEGREVAGLLLDRYPRASVVWAASDQLAIGASEALRALGKTIGTDVFVGGCDLSALGLEEVIQGNLTATVASSMLSYAEILVYLYDYIHGLDFAEIIRTELSLDVHVADHGNAAAHLALYRSYRSIDFRKLSRVYNPQLEAYNFSLESLRSGLDP